MRDQTQVFYSSSSIIGTVGKRGNFVYFKNDNPIGACLFHYGEWAEQEFDVIEKLVGEDTNCLDIGSNIGTHTVALSKLCKAGIIFSIEPQFYIYRVLSTNITINDCLNIIPIHAGISNTIKETYDSSSYISERSANYGEFKLSQEKNGMRVPCIRLDEINYFNKPIGFIKMDVELHEVSAILSGRELITRDKPAMYIEFNDHKGNDELLILLNELGYNCYWHFYEKFNKNNFYKNPTNIWLGESTDICKEESIARWYETNLIAIHKEKDVGMFNEKIELGDNIVKYLIRNNLIKE